MQNYDALIRGTVTQIIQQDLEDFRVWTAHLHIRY